MPRHHMIERLLGRHIAVVIGLCALLLGALAASATAAPTAYVANGGDNNVTPIDVATNTAGTPIPVGTFPNAIAIAPNGATAYVTNELDDTVTPIDVASNTAGAPITVGAEPVGIAITPNGATAYVANFDDNTVTPIDVASNTAGAPITVGNGPRGIAITPNGTTAYVANSNDNTVTPIDVATNTAGPPIAVGSFPEAIAITPNGRTAYVTNQNSQDATPIDLTTNTAGTPIPLGNEPFGIAITPDGVTAYVTDRDFNNVTPIDVATNTAGTPIPVGVEPQGIAITPTITATADRAQVNFGGRDVGAGPSGTQTIRIESTGTGNLTPTAATLSGANPGEFSITSDGCANSTVLPGQSCTIGVSFDPTSTGQKAASLEVPSNDPNSPTSVALTGTGTVPPAPVSPPPAPTQANSVCNAAPTRSTSKKGVIRLTPQALAIQQRIDAAALRRLNAANVWINQGIVPTDLCAGAFGPGAFQAGINWVGGAPVDTTPPSPRALRIIKKTKRAATFTVSRRQIRINDTISRALFARAKATRDRIENLTGGNLAQGAKLTGRPLYPGLATSGPLPPSQALPATPLSIGPLPRAGRITVSAAQLRKTQKRSQQAITIANRANDRITQGLTERQFKDGSIGTTALG